MTEAERIAEVGILLARVRSGLRPDADRAFEATMKLWKIFTGSYEASERFKEALSGQDVDFS